MFKSIVVPVDLDELASSNEALNTALCLAKHFSSQLTICSVVRDAKAIGTGEWLPLSYEQLLFDALDRLGTLASRLDTEITVNVEVGTGSICGGILDVAYRVAADLILLGTHRPKFSDHLFAAQAARVARRATCSVMIVRPTVSGPGSSAPADARAEVTDG